MEHPRLQGCSILVVEDEPLIAADIAQALKRAGADVTTTGTLRHALLLVEKDGLAAAVLDHALGDEDASKLCERLKERGIPFLTYSGYEQLEGACRDGVHVSKPADTGLLVAKVQALLGR
jgi:DNA-binding response OmpR family regulator